jgi:hypothetical protein
VARLLGDQAEHGEAQVALFEEPPEAPAAMAAPVAAVLLALGGVALTVAVEAPVPAPAAFAGVCDGIAREAAEPAEVGMMMQTLSPTVFRYIEFEDISKFGRVKRFLRIL